MYARTQKREHKKMSRIEDGRGIKKKKTNGSYLSVQIIIQLCASAYATTLIPASMSESIMMQCKF